MAARKTMAYSGPFYLKEVPGLKQRLFHRMDLSLPLNWVGQMQLRAVEMRDEEVDGLVLTLGPEASVIHRGLKRAVRLRRKKAGDNSSAKVLGDAKL
jgi:hypothetical protein